MNLIQFSTISNFYLLEVVQKCQFGQFCVLREISNHLFTSKVERIAWANDGQWPHKRMVYKVEIQIYCLKIRLFWLFFFLFLYDIIPSLGPLESHFWTSGHVSPGLPGHSGSRRCARWISSRSAVIFWPVNKVRSIKTVLNVTERRHNGVFPKWSRAFVKFSDFSEFRECDKSLNHELGLNLKILSFTCVLLVL